MKPAIIVQLAFVFVALTACSRSHRSDNDATNSTVDSAGRITRREHPTSAREREIEIQRIRLMRIGDLYERHLNREVQKDEAIQWLRRMNDGETLQDVEVQILANASRQVRSKSNDGQGATGQNLSEKAHESEGLAQPNDDENEVDEPKDRARFLSHAEMIAHVIRSLVRINVQTIDGGSGIGSGFVAHDVGLIVTNHHVVEDATRATVVFSDGGETPVVGFRVASPGKDIAILEIDPEAIGEIGVLTLLEGLPQQGETVFALGAPRGFVRFRYGWNR